MELSNKERNSPREHIAAIFKDYVASERILQTLTNLSNTVIETALSGQCKFLFEILQNADDAFDDSTKYKDIKLQLVLLDNHLVIQHNGKAFDYNDVERICDYASQIEEAKANELIKTGYKGLGFKSLFNLSDCIYIHSNGYSFRFDKSYWPIPEKIPWQVIPIWCEDLPLSEKYTYDKPVNFVMKINDAEQLNVQLNDLIDHPEFLLHLYRVNWVELNLNGADFILKRRVELFGLFHKIVFLKNDCLVNTWISRNYKCVVPLQLRKRIEEASELIYPDKIKNAKDIIFSFTLCVNEMLEEVLTINGLCYNTLPTQLQLSLPYHVNSLFILNLDRTQFHENEWNEFLIYQIGYHQLSFLKDLALIPHLKNFVIKLLVHKTNHPYNVFNEAFSRGFEEAKSEIAWLPAYKNSCLIKLGEAWIDEIHFFKQNLKNIQDRILQYVIDYDVKEQDFLKKIGEAHCFSYNLLFDRFPKYYYPQLTENSYIKFLGYLYDSRKECLFYLKADKLITTPFLKTRDGTLVSPTKALLEEKNNPILDFTRLNPVDNKYLNVCDKESFKTWLENLGATRLRKPIEILRESIFQWIRSNTLKSKIDLTNHKAIIEYLSKHFQQFNLLETEKLKENLPILTKANTFQIVSKCYLPNTIILQELEKIISDCEIISSCYDINALKDFFNHLGISQNLRPIEIFRKYILAWIKKGEIKSKFTTENYKPIIEFLSIEYQKIEDLITASEKELLKKMPVLTCSEIFQDANSCFFDSAIPPIQGFENLIIKNNLVCKKNFNENVLEFLVKIGVSEKLDATIVLRSSILKWIEEETIIFRINSENQYDILKYIAENWINIRGSDNHQPVNSLTKYETTMLRKLPILTESGKFREAQCCFWNVTDNDKSDDEIPNLESIISSDEIVSFEYNTAENTDPKNIKNLLNELGVRCLRFTDIYDRFCEHLTKLENIEWFFSNLIKYWKKNNSFANKDKLLTQLKEKLYSTYVLSLNGMYLLKDFYSYCFFKICRIDPNVLPVLPCENLPEDLERWLGIKQELELSSIEKLLEAIGRKQNFGKEVQRDFFCIILKQLRLKDKNEIKRYSLKLFSNDNKLKPAKDLYYFIEEDVECLIDSCYLKRINEMSHKETLELAELCGVNLLYFSQEVNYGGEIPIYDKALKEFYLERLLLIVIKESKASNESLDVVLENLFSQVLSIELHKCQNILIQYPFDKPVETRYYFDSFKVYVTGKWRNLRTKIHEHIKKKLELTSDITEILDMESVVEDKTEWLYYQKENLQTLDIITEKIAKVSSLEEMVDKSNTGDHSISDNKHLLNQNAAVAQTSIKSVDVATDAVGDDNVNNELTLRQDVNYRLELDNIDTEQACESISHIPSDEFYKDCKDSINSNGVLYNQDVDVEQTKVKTLFDLPTDSSCSGNVNDQGGVFRQKINYEHEFTKSDTNQTQKSKSDIHCDDKLCKDSGDVIGKNAPIFFQFGGVEHKSSFLKARKVDLTTDASDGHNTHAEFTFGRNFEHEFAIADVDQTDDSKNTTSSVNELHKDSGDVIVENELLSNQDVSIGQSKEIKIDITIDNSDGDNVDDEVTIRRHESGCSKNHNSSDDPKNCNHRDDSKIHSSHDDALCYKTIDAGKWSHVKDKIHKYTKENSNLQTDKEDIGDGKPITQVIKVELICPMKERPQYLYKIEEKRKIFSAQPWFITCNTHLKDKEQSKNKEFIVGIISAENSNDYSDYKLSILIPHSSMKFDGRKLLITFTENSRTRVVRRYNATSDSFVQNDIESDARLTQAQTHHERREEKSHVFEHFPSPLNLHLETGMVFQTVTADESQLKRQAEEYVFSFLQDHYLEKYPEAQILKMKNGHFTLEWQSNTTEIIWLNESEDRGMKFDLYLKKNDEIKQCIEVKPVCQDNVHSFNLADYIFSRQNQFKAENSECNGKYCIYCVRYKASSLKADMTIFNALFKVKPLKITSL